ncbi:AI-2E family transporter [Falsigemmobacter faecalis]|uniref:AI-2E family transporter n=1 Tax=Falsigemmobacter faecalis TaxID=2488730 RepID=A0A3P3DGZ5_9RHOB|nr:AI-2E family transporter [Falsigemmobacter faecalis]RRH73535.1 AI-2E family transporter [Falsigemmobacter faecalis]
MAHPVRDQLKYWAIGMVLLFVVLWALGKVMLPFLVGGAIAYFLDPVADRLQKLGLSRTAATAIISLAALFATVALFLSVIPTLVRQLSDLINAAPDIIRKLMDYLYERFPELTDNTSTIRTSLAELGEAIKSRGMTVVNTVIGSAVSVLDWVLFLVIVPVVAFYLLLDWDRMMRRIDELLPRDYAPTVRHLAGEIDRVLAAFVRGQLTVCLILGGFYAASLAAVGLQFGFIVGAIAGAITFIPYIGSIVGGVLAIGLALVQYWGDWWSVGLIAAIFAVGQFLEGNIITPRLVGGSVGLHPVWLLFALSAFGTLFGFAGMLVAVPVAAAIGVLVRYASARYVESDIYRGATPPEP